MHKHIQCSTRLHVHVHTLCACIRPTYMYIHLVAMHVCICVITVHVHCGFSGHTYMYIPVVAQNLPLKLKILTKGNRDILKQLYTHMVTFTGDCFYFHDYRKIFPPGCCLSETFIIKNINKVIHGSVLIGVSLHHC